ncbi:YceI family protein [Polymorphum gilvum]|uniref:YceI like family n=1 Tax=Polymorphum gilvum (strain LMG 25793 / CGMCC 1.9160 / SL003B-26A1) TaxID=991905 RepID=F2J5X3_POLGS|nr:YceI family protein [Polymorphum gilvum]ADZ71227.1 YceI like family [Polymorphum gilvum SL003B-26A1]
MTLPTLRSALVAAALALVTQPAAAADWAVDAADSSLAFTARQGDTAVPGRFERFEVAITLDPQDLSGASISVTVDTASVATEDAQVGATLASDGWLSTAAFPTAAFASTAVRRIEGERYEAEGTFTLRGVSMPLVLPFTLAIDGDTAKAAGAVTLLRADYGVGAGIPADTVGAQVEVSFALTAKAR